MERLLQSEQSNKFRTDAELKSEDSVYHSHGSLLLHTKL